MNKFDSEKVYKKQLLIDSISSAIALIFFTFEIIYMIYFHLNNPSSSSIYIIILVASIFFIGVVFVTINLVQDISLYKNPLNGVVFKNYGDYSKINSIVDEINNNIILENSRVKMGNEYIYSKSNLNELCKYDDILVINKSFNRRSELLIYVDKYNVTHDIKFSKIFMSNNFNETYNLLCDKCKNAKLGEGKMVRKYLKDNILK